MERTPPIIDMSLEIEFGNEMPNTREILASFVYSLLQQREEAIIERLTSTVETQMARSLEEFS
jgi:hypothetical protein